MKDHFIILGAIILLCIGFFLIGLETKQRTIEKRALKTKEKDCYNWQDIETIIFNEIQE